MKTDFLTRRSIPLVVLTGFLVLGSGCKNPSPPAEQPTAQQVRRNRLPLRRATTSRLAVTFRQRSRLSRR